MSTVKSATITTVTMTGLATIPSSTKTYKEISTILETVTTFINLLIALASYLIFTGKPVCFFIRKI